MFCTVKTTLERMIGAVGLISGLMILLVGCILAVEIVCRYMGSPTEWIQEWSIYLFGWAMLGGAAYTLQQGRHVRVELLMMHIGPKASRIMEFFASLICLAICLLIAAYGWEHLADVLATGETTSTVLRLPLWLTDCHIFAGYVLLSIQFALLATACGCDLIPGRSLADRNTDTGSPTAEEDTHV